MQALVDGARNISGATRSPAAPSSPSPASPDGEDHVTSEPQEAIAPELQGAYLGAVKFLRERLAELRRKLPPAEARVQESDETFRLGLIDPVNHAELLRLSEGYPVTVHVGLAYGTSGLRFAVSGNETDCADFLLVALGDRRIEYLYRHGQHWHHRQARNYITERSSI